MGGPAYVTATLLAGFFGRMRTRVALLLLYVTGLTVVHQSSSRVRAATFFTLGQKETRVSEGERALVGTLQETELRQEDHIPV